MSVTQDQNIASISPLSSQKKKELNWKNERKKCPLFMNWCNLHDVWLNIRNKLSRNSMSSIKLQSFIATLKPTEAASSTPVCM